MRHPYSPISRAWIDSFDGGLDSPKFDFLRDLVRAENACKDPQPSEYLAVRDGAYNIYSSMGTFQLFPFYLNHPALIAYFKKLLELVQSDPVLIESYSDSVKIAGYVLEFFDGDTPVNGSRVSLSHRVPLDIAIAEACVVRDTPVGELCTF